MTELSLSNLIGTDILAFVPVFHPAIWQTMKLLAIENSGIWVEYRPMSEQAMKAAGKTMTPNTAVLFLPFSSIHFVVAVIPEPYVSDEALK
jgi:hypothetical protein